MEVWSRMEVWSGGGAGEVMDGAKNGGGKQTLSAWSVNAMVNLLVLHRHWDRSDSVILHP